MKSIALFYAKNKEQFGQAGGSLMFGLPQGIFYLSSYLKKEELRYI